MKPLLFSLFISFIVVSCNTKPITDNSGSSDICLADPTIMVYDSVYYLYGTVSGGLDSAGAGFPVYISKNLKHWEGPVGAKHGFALLKGDAFGDKGFWAPQVFRYKGKFYMAYTANEHIAIATSNSPLGPFTNDSKKALEAPVRQIDPYIFFDDDGKIYLYHVRLDSGNRIYVAEMKHDLSGIIPETLHLCVSGKLPWENTAGSGWPVTEGPTVVKHKGVYYMTYSANDFRNPDYAVGYATAISPLGPWKKSPINPIIDKTLVGINGTGHGDIFTGTDHQKYYVFHTHFSNDTVRPRKAALIKISFSESGSDSIDLLQAGKNTFFMLKN